MSLNFHFPFIYISAETWD